jgi:hypothetical protein
VNKKNIPSTWKPEKGKRQEESSFCEQKEAKKLHPLAAGSLAHRVSYEKSFFLLFFKKRRLFLSFRWPVHSRRNPPATSSGAARSSQTIRVW